jgi:hypothetical protein
VSALGAVGRIVLAIVLGLALLVGVLWAAAALWIDGPKAREVAVLLVAGFIFAEVAVFAFLRTWTGAFVAGAVLVLGVLVWWLAIPASNDRDWQPDVARLPTAAIDGNRVTITNVRNFQYRSETDYTERWETRTYDLAKLRGVDLFLSYWGPTEIAHTIVSWEFEDAPPLAISIETRKERGEQYSALLGFFRQYELYYVVADERDLVGLRTNHRGEQVFLYRFRAGPQFARALLLSYLGQINDLAEKPKWYNAATHNCTTTIRFHGMQAGIQNPLDWRLFLNGHLDELLYERGDIDTSQPFPEMRVHSDITARAKAAGDAPDFSMRIREGVPPRPPPRNAGRT